MAYGKISKKQQEILDYLKNTIITRGFPPSVREICRAVDLKSTSSVHAHLETLEKNGFIRRDPSLPRAIEITDEEFNRTRIEQFESGEPTPELELVQVPVLGTVAAGQPLLAVENITEYMPIPVSHLPNAETFLLQVKGESMINAGILSGDFVLVEKRTTASNGDMVVAMVDDSATVKTYFKENGYYRLQPENDTMDPILVYGELQILGKVIGVFRFFR
ncbi:transcriptional repressor LexA [Novisyntrophococcus fermenticellae]|uniref:transcriptional repressor LexA n=1 Tax=Novisyntrophococcus fermenticellae TaxID=2068655 RepID=UPI001E52C652|nr:transcriptional repressor LexA [Novisyntrophococcus fermenticellae]